MKKSVELLAPAGSFQVMKACISAGADAVYMGLSRFSARAFADNAETGDYAEAIRYAHLHGKKLYLTLNTLLKEREIESEIRPLLDPLYAEGLDGIIVQDLGLMELLREEYPLLPLHVSTQAAVTRPGAALILKEAGAKRVVPARELKLSEIRRIKEESGLEVECFIHGALCYSYSGQCLFSSIVGGRSGNRGRCAQSCRMNYVLYDENGKRLNPKSQEYLLSLKDLNTLSSLPELVDAGADSLKIEGRMKKAEYAAGVTAVYRKYLDRCLSLIEKYGTTDPEVIHREGYRTEQSDEKKLFDLFNRCGFTDGYLKRENGKEMVTLNAPSFREENEALTEEIREKYIRKEHETPLEIHYRFAEGEKGVLSLSASLDGREFTSRTESDFTAEKASSRPAETSEVEKQLKKLGGTGFTAIRTEGSLEGDLFLPVSQLNALRREAVSALSETILQSYRRSLPEDRSGKILKREERKNGALSLRILVSTASQLDAALSSRAGSILLESTISEAEEYASLVRKCREAGKECILVFPQIFREKAIHWFDRNLELIRAAGFQGFLVRNLEECRWIENAALPGKLFSDYHLYVMNSRAKGFLKSRGIECCTASVELASPEIRDMKEPPEEILLYGRLPMMVSANCLVKTTAGCDRRNRTLILEDRMQNRMSAECVCRYCMNRIWNVVPLSLLTLKSEVERLPMRYGRLDFTTESREEAADVIGRFEGAYLDGKEVPELPEFTRGHFRRKVD